MMTIGADALILDLEDAVPEAGKSKGREGIRRVIQAALSDSLRPDFFVRINSVRTPHFEEDLETVSQGVVGLLLSKCQGPADVKLLDEKLTRIERDRGLKLGSVEILPLCETAEGILNAHAICLSSVRVQRLVGVCNWPEGGDTHGDLRYKPDPDGLEPPWLSGRLMLDARAAGIDNLLAGPPLELRDEARLLRHAVRAKELGANGSLAIHPRQVRIINSTFTPTQEEIQQARLIQTVMAAAIARGDAAVRMGNEMIDSAHVRTSAALLARARILGLDVNEG
jgi:citrate lyase subunit beta/citryl-CoA lyase